ncbi:MAG: WYL domain-containing protein [Pseudomonadales bacterium]|nr:WYL domain-containing protein [Pseudomonadales bacterium]
MSSTPRYLTQAQCDRIAHIDFTLLFKGEANRADLVDRFSITPAQATKDFTQYRELAPANIRYDEKLRTHLRGDQFKPLFDYDVVRTLATVAKVTEAIHKAKPLSTTYVSLSSGESRREIVPHTLVDNGLRWHVRGFDRKSGEFRDFVLTRIKEATMVEASAIDEQETESQDRQWNRFVELELVPHPCIQHQEAIELDYDMDGGVMKVEIRAATAGYLSRQWHVDCSPAHTLTGPEYQLWLRNSQALYGVQNLILAPGRTEQPSG